MQIKVEKNVGGIEGLCVITPAVHGDSRGYFMETYNQRDMQEAGIYAPIYDLHVRYYAPLGMEDVAEIHTRYVHKRGARLDYEYEIYRERDHVLCVSGSTTQLFIDPAGELMVDLPDYYRHWQEKYLSI